MSHALKLSDSSAVIADTLYFERRRHPRRKSRGQVTAVVREPGRSDAPAKMLTLDLIDQSECGLGVASTEPVAVGSRITVFFPPHGPEPGFDLIGEVVRCRSNDDRHTLGILLGETASKQAG
ncbi:MAG: PilZ domain-containing protein [Phycisphaeraceae bacterium]